MTLPEKVLAELLRLTGAKNKTQAVMTAVQGEIRARKLGKIKMLAGSLEFEEAENLRHSDAHHE
ncbi:MAG: DUF2191 domain-containing protein [bacterium]